MDMSTFKFYNDIQGWMTEEEIRYMASICILQETYNCTSPCILEVGCWLGRTTVHLAQFGPVQVVDTFKGSEEEEHKRILKEKPQDWLFNEFMKNIQGKNLNKIEVFRGTSDEFFAQNKSKYKVILIDGSHEKETVKRDLLNALVALEDHGYLFIDDINWLSVKEAIKETGISPITNVTNKLGLYHKS